MIERRTVWWEEGRVGMIDQTRLPGELAILRLETEEAVAEAIRSMRVRGAPAIGVTAALGLALAARARAGRAPGRLRTASAGRGPEAARDAPDRRESLLGASTACCDGRRGSGAAPVRRTAGSRGAGHG